MIYNRYHSTIKLTNTEYTIGETVIANYGTLYAGLSGIITEIRTDKDKVTENPGADIYVDFIPHALPRDEERFRAQCDAYGVDFDSFAYTGIIMAPEQIRKLISKDLLRVTFYVVYEAWMNADNDSYGENIDVFSSYEEAMSKLDALVNQYVSTTDVSSMAIDVGHDFIEYYENGFRNENYSRFEIQKKEIFLDPLTAQSVYQLYSNVQRLEDLESVIYDEDGDFTYLTDVQREDLLNDGTALCERFDDALSKNDAYYEAYFGSARLSVQEVVDECGYGLNEMSVFEHAERMSSLEKALSAKGASFASGFYDREHLNCFWYDGNVATINYRGHNICFDVHGDVSVSYINSDDEEVVLRHKGGEAPLYKCEQALTLIQNDALLRRKTQNGTVVYSNNNWISVCIETESGVCVMPSQVADSSNVLEAVEQQFPICIQYIDALFEVVGGAISDSE